MGTDGGRIMKLTFSVLCLADTVPNAHHAPASPKEMHCLLQSSQKRSEGSAVQCSSHYPQVSPEHLKVARSD